LRPQHTAVAHHASAVNPHAHAHCASHRQHAGSTRLYEDPDVDEYEGLDDVGYWRREVVRQDEFVAQHLERVTVRAGVV